MKKTKLLVAATLTGALLCACSGRDGDNAANDFAADFGRKAQAAKMDSLKMVYPDIASADSIAFTFIPDSMSVVSAGKDSIYDVSYGNGVTAKIRLNGNGQGTILETRGLFAYPKDRETFARAIGAVKGDLSDAFKAKRMAAIDLVAEHIYDQYAARLKHAIVLGRPVVTKNITFAMEEGRGYRTLTNTTDKPIKGSDYTITWEGSYIGFGIEKTSYRTERGRDIPANGTIKVTYSFSGHSHGMPVKVNMKQKSKDEYMATYKPDGSEYDSYVKEFGDPTKDNAAATGASADGPFKISGKLGGKLPVHITLNKGMKDGSYYYDKYGPSAKLHLKVLDYNPKTGSIKLEEHNDRGEVTSTFSGTLTATAFRGKMTSFAGKTYDFNMVVVK